MARKRTEPENWWKPPAPDPICPLCRRPIPPEQRDAHHLVPKSEGGRDTVLMHRICHRQIHALFNEVELATRLHTVEALLEQPAIRKFVAWVRKKPPGFYEKTRRGGDRR